MRFEPLLLKLLLTTSSFLFLQNASPVGLGAVSTQLQDGLWRVISDVSRSFSDVELRYSQTEKEALGLVWACERFSLCVWKKI